MKKNIIFSKYSNERAPRFAIRTDIAEGEDGQKCVIKTACYPEGRAHVRRLLDWQEQLSRQFSQTGLLVNRARPEDGEGVAFEYLQGETLEQRIYGIQQSRGEAAAFARLAEYLQLLKGCAAVPFVRTEEFVRVFGDAGLAEGLPCMPVTDIDMVTENIFLTGEPGCEQQTLIDYEWTFDFPIPVNFVIYRILHYFLERCLPKEQERLSFYCEREGITKEEQRTYGEMERAFQAYVEGSHTPLRELFADITPGSVTLSALGVQGTAEESGQTGGFIASLFPEEEEAEWRIKSFWTPGADGSFEIIFDLSGRENELEGRQSLRFDPLEGRLCRIRPGEIQCETPMGLEPINAVREDGADEFWTRDPAYRITGEFAQAKRIAVRGQIEILNIEELLPKLGQLQGQLDTRTQELAQLRATKGFRALEAGRRVRNYFAVRIRAVPDRIRRAVTHRDPYHDWYLAHSLSEQELMEQRGAQPENGPKISILVPTYRTPERFLVQMIDSVLAQTYENWELCIADGGSGERLRKLLREYEKRDARIKVAFLEENRGISANTNGALALATGEFIALLDHDDLLAPEALYEIAAVLLDGQADLAYSDEDKVDLSGRRFFDPHFKPDFSPDLLRSHNYITHFCVIRRSLVDRVGGFHSEFDGAQDYDLCLRCAERTDRIRHVPKILYHWRLHRNSTAKNPESKTYAYEAGRRALEEHLKREGLEASVEMTKLWGMYRVTYATPGDPLVSVIIPNMDHAADLEKCVRSILEKSTYRNLEIVVVENNSREPGTFECYEKLKKEFPQVRVVTWEREFNYSAINNFGVSEAKGEYLLLLNNDTELIEPGAIGGMLGICMRKDVGCVGAKLLYPDGTVQHAGIVLGFGGFAGHVFTGIAATEPGYAGRAQIIGNFSAVTAACMMVSRRVYREAGGFSEDLAVALNDVDFCMKLRSSGYLIVLDPFALWYHYESKSRGYEDTPEKKERFQREIRRFRSRWGETVDAPDPYYNPNFSVKAAPFTLE